MCHSFPAIKHPDLLDLLVELHDSKFFQCSLYVTNELVGWGWGYITNKSSKHKRRLVHFCAAWTVSRDQFLYCRL